MLGNTIPPWKGPRPLEAVSRGMRSFRLMLAYLIFGVLSLFVLATAASANTVTLNPTQNGWTTSGTNTLRTSDLRVQGTPAERTFLKFDLSNTGIPAGSTINSVTLKMYMTQAPTGSCHPTPCTPPTHSETYEIHQSTTGTNSFNWTESDSLNWFNDVPPSASIVSTTTGTTAGVFLTWTGTALTDAYIAEEGNNWTLLVIDPSNGVAYEGILSSRTDATNPPELIVDYTPPSTCSPTSPGSITITRHDYTGPDPIPWGVNGEFNISFTVTAGDCQDLTDVKAQGGLASNLVIGDAMTCTGSDPCISDQGIGSLSFKSVGKGNEVFTWTLTSLAKANSVTFTVPVYVTYNPGNQMVCDVIKSFTGGWTVSGFWVNNNVLVNVSDGPTDQLEVEVSCPAP